MRLGLAARGFHVPVAHFDGSCMSYTASKFLAWFLLLVGVYMAGYASSIHFSPKTTLRSEEMFAVEGVRQSIIQAESDARATDTTAPESVTVDRRQASIAVHYARVAFEDRRRLVVFLLCCSLGLTALSIIIVVYFPSGDYAQTQRIAATKPVEPTGTSSSPSDLITCRAPGESPGGSLRR